MKNIPIRQINSHCLNCPSNFNIRDVRELIDGKDLIQPLHRHDFFYVLALEKGKGDHRIDFQSYKIRDNSVFFMRPGQVHEIVLKAGPGQLGQSGRGGHKATPCAEAVR